MYDQKKPPASERNLSILGRPGIEPLLDSHKAAALLDVHPRTLQRMVLRGESRAFKWASCGGFGRRRSAIGSIGNRQSDPLRKSVKSLVFQWIRGCISATLQIAIRAVSQGGILNPRARYQFGSLSLKQRAKSADAWEFRYYEDVAGGGRSRKAAFIGTTDEFKTEAQARKAVEAHLLKLNAERPQHSSWECDVWRIVRPIHRRGVARTLLHTQVVPLKHQRAFEAKVG